jgi:hypothetical protein
VPNGNTKAAVLNGSGRQACFHPDFLALCGHFCLQAIACERRDPESKGIVEGNVRYVKHNALAGRDDELLTFADYTAFAPRWRDGVANLRIHETTRERPLDRFQQERPLLRPLPSIPFDTDEIVPRVVATAIRCRRLWRARPSHFAPMEVQSVCCTKAKWSPGMSDVTNVGSRSCCRSIAWLL